MVVVIQGLPAVHLPVTQFWDSSGSYTFTVPSWANFLDIIALGAGGGGGDTDGSSTGSGGGAGNWDIVTIARASGWPTGNVTVNVGGGGHAASYGSAASGSPGGASSASGTGMSTVSGAGGSGGAYAGGSQNGGSPIDQTYLGTTYISGAGDTTGTGAIAPGGGGIGNNTYSASATFGADGKVWIVARQV